MEAVQHGAKVIRPDRNHGRKADRRVHRIASADPIPELKHVGGINAELLHFRSISRHRNKVPGEGFLISAETCMQPIAGSVRIRHCFESGESLRRNDEKSFCWVEIPNRLSEIGTVYVGNEPKGHGSLAVMLQGFIGHDWS